MCAKKEKEFFCDSCAIQKPFLSSEQRRDVFAKRASPSEVLLCVVSENCKKTPEREGLMTECLQAVCVLGAMQEEHGCHHPDRKCIITLCHEMRSTDATRDGMRCSENSACNLGHCQEAKDTCGRHLSGTPNSYSGVCCSNVSVKSVECRVLTPDEPWSRFSLQ